MHQTDGKEGIYIGEKAFHSISNGIDNVGLFFDHWPLTDYEKTEVEKFYRNAKYNNMDD